MTVVRLTNSGRRKPPDDNDLAVSGELPDDPAEGTEVVSRPQVVLGPDLTRVVDETIQMLANAPVFQRSGTLVDIVRDAQRKDGVVCPGGAPRIRFQPSARLREVLDDCIDYRTRANQKGKTVLAKAHVPLLVVQTLAARGEWRTIRPLTGITEWPVLRADGSLLSRRGYDRHTGLVYEPSCEVAVPARPTEADARAAVATLLDVVCDFPFATEAHRSAWLAALLTLLARPAIEGPTPLTLIDANERGSGKTLLADIIGMICRGKPLPRRSAPDDPAEWRKALLAIAIAADPVVLIDNVVRTLRSDSLDAVLTGTSFRDRVLGRNEELSLEIRTVFLATANNCQLSADLVRRSLHVRLEVHQENPEQRAGWRHDPLLGYVFERRAELLAAALTVLRAYVVADRPPLKLRPMGSYEAWSRVVRAPLVWLGLPDPAETQDGLRENADTEREGLAALLEAWHAVYGDRAVVVSRMLKDLDPDHLPPTEQSLKDALGAVCTGPGKLGPQLGYQLRKNRGRIIGGLLLERVSHGKGGWTWRVRDTGARRQGHDGHEGHDGLPFRARPFSVETQAGWEESSSPSSPSSPFDDGGEGPWGPQYDAGAGQAELWGEDE